MSDLASQAYNEAQKFFEFGERVVHSVRQKIEEHATRTVPAALIGTALFILFKRKPLTYAKFLEMYEDSVGYAIPSVVLGKELWRWVNPLPENRHEAEQNVTEQVEENFSEFDDRQKAQIRSKILQLATETIPAAAIGTGIFILLKRNPRSFEEFFEHYADSVGHSVAAAGLARELWNWVSPPDR